MATRFATKMIRKYGLLQHDSDAYVSQSFGWTEVRHLPPLLPDELLNEVETSKRLREMAHFLEIIRNLQSRLSSKFKRPGQGLVRCCVVILFQLHFVKRMLVYSHHFITGRWCG